MSNKYLWGRTKRLWYLGLLLVASLFSQNAWSQVSGYSFSEGVSTYASLSGGTASIATGDDGVENGVAIGFTFNFGGTNYTHFCISTNGWIKLGTSSSVTIGSGSFTNTLSNTATHRPLIAGLWDDGHRNTGSISYLLSGTAPNQVLEVNFENVNVGGGGSTSGTNFVSYSIKLYETTNVVEIDYGSALASAGSLSASIGLNDMTSFLSVTPAATSTVSSASANNSINATVMASAVSKKYTFSPPSCFSPSAVVATVTSASSANFSWTAPGVAPGVGYEYYVSTSNTTPSTAANTGVETATTTGSATGLTANTTYYVFVRSECTADADYSAWTASTSFFTGYCASTSTGGTSYISNVTTTGGSTNISNASGGYSASGYGDFSAQSVTCQQSLSFTLNIQNNDDVGVSVYVDWNNDLDFSDAGETVANAGGYLSSPYLYSPTISVDVAQPLGSYRMRIRTNWSSTTPAACGSISRGETEDYTLIVTAAPSCTAPTAPVVSGVSNSAATLSWTASVSAPTNGYDLYVSTTNTAPTGSETYTDVAGLSEALSGLTGSTTYYWWVRSDCGGSTYSSWMTGGSFTTECDPTVAFPAAEPFDTYLPTTCWKEGLNGDLTAGPASTGASVNNWTSDGFANSGFTGAAKYNMYLANNNAWLISPEYTVPASPAHRMTYDVAATQFGATTALTTAWEADDYVEVLISTSGMTNWTVIETYNSGNVPSNAGQGEAVDLTSYAGQTVRFAFRVVEGATDGSADFDFFIDNVVVEETPSCLIPTALSSVGATTSTIDFQWTASASDPSNGYEWEVRTSGAAGSGATGLAANGSEGYGITAASAGGLSANTTYSIYVRSNCGAGGYSAWTSALTVFTGYCTPAPTSVDASGITNVTFSGVNNTTGAESGNYGDYTSLTGGSFPASTLATVNITYTTGYTYGTKIWVDWNNDLDFTDSGEQVYTGLSTSASPTTLVATFTIPALTPVADYRMRIGGTDTDSGPSTPCYNGSYGSFEDYTLEVTAAPSCLAPSAPVSGSLTSSSATLSWTAASPAPANGYDLYVSLVNTAPTGSETYTDVTGTSEVVGSLSDNTTYYWWVRSDCGGSDYSPWLTGGSFTTPCSAVATFPFNETFEAASSTRSCWATNDYVSGTANWVYAAGATSVLTTAQEGSLNARFYSANYSGNTTRLVSPAMDLSSLTTPRVTFYYAMPDWGGDQDELRVYYKTSAAGSWTLITGAEFTTSTTSWTQANFTLPSPSSDYYLAFEGYSGYGYGAVLDNVVVEETPSCLEPTAVVVSSITNTGATISWTASSSDPANGYEWEVRTSGAAGSGATGLEASGSTGYGVVTDVVTGLTGATDYSVYVRSNCGSYSVWTVASTFTTLCDPVTLPYTENFNPSSTSRDCWLINDNNGDYVNDWLIGDIYTWAYYWDGVDAANEFAGIYTSSVDNDDYLISPALPLTGNEWVTYDVSSSVASGGTGYEVLLSTTGTSPGDFTTTLLAVTNPTNTSFEGTYIDLTAYSGTVYLAWHIPGGVNGDESVYIDNVTVEVMPACIPPTGVSVTGFTTNWTAAWSGASDVIIEYGPVGFTPGTDGTAGVGGTIVSGSSSSAMFTVPADANYEMYVRANCTASSDGYSTNVGPYSFTSYTIVPYSGSQTITTCSATIYDHAGPASDYTNGANGYLVIYPATPGSVISITGTLESESGWDYLRIYRGVGTAGSQLGSYSGTQSINILSDQLDQPITIGFTSDVTGTDVGFDLDIACASACGLETTIDAPTTTSSSVCSGENFTLSLDIPAAIGYTYQWYSSTGGGNPFTAISGATSSTLVTSQTVQRQYVCYVDCEYGDQIVSGIRTIYMNAPTSCYGASGATSTADEDINDVIINGASAPVVNTCGTGTYTDFTGTPAFNIARGAEGTVSVAVCDAAASYYYADVAVFIDLNQDGDFADAGESIYQAPSFLNVVAGSAVFNGTFSIPSTATLGNTRMRVVAVESSTNITVNPTGTYTWGETEDYTVTIVPGVANDLFANATTVSNQSTYPSCSNLSGTLIGASDNTAGVVGDDVFYKFVAQSTAYRISTSGASGDVTLELRDGTNTLISSGVVTAGGTGSNEVLVATGLTTLTTYYVRVINQSVTPANFSICVQKISGSGCNYGPNYNNLCSNFKSTWSGATSYSVTFFDGTNLYTGGSTGTTLFTLASAVGDPGNVLAGGLRYNTTYTTSVTANYVLTDFSSNVLATVSVPSTTPCSVIIGAQPDVALRSTDRSTSVGNNARAYGSFIACEPWLCATSEYLWRVTEIDPITEAVTSPATVIESNSSSRFLRINASTNAIFHTGGRYIIEVAPRFSAGHDGSYGTAYDLLIAGVAPGGMIMEDAGTEVVLVDKINEGGVFASLYPNPNTGESVNLNIAGIESESVNISIMDASGRVVWSNRYVVDGALFTTVNFDRPLAAGMYMVEMVYNGQVMTQRMMVQK